MGESSRDGGNDLRPSAQSEALLALHLAPGEAVLWSGRPDPGTVARRMIPRSLAGLGFVAFTLLWIAGAVQGKNNNWDGGKAVAPFAPHNVRIAALAGLWMLPPGLYMLTWPLLAWRRAGGTTYALTDRRAMIIAGHRAKSFRPEDLALVQCDEQAGGSGDLVFENRKTWTGQARPVGFLGIERVREVEALLRRALGEAHFAAPAPSVGGRPDGGFGRPATSDDPGPVRTWKLPVSQRVILVGICLVFSIVPIVMAVNTALVLAWGLQRGQVPEVFPLICLGAVVVSLGFAFAIRHILATPVEISLAEDGTVTFRSWLRTEAIPAGEIRSVETGGNRFEARVRHGDGSVRLINNFPDFRSFLASLKVSNPDVVIRGF
ncbi:hypothetical protein [Singulisphaera sp. PoT]|uniref:hypothetical protein n=1 Tax=Singulisphaera sp. PoT TaxID=3411797 RepID=UPI003BF502ED